MAGSPADSAVRDPFDRRGDLPVGPGGGDVADPPASAAAAGDPGDAGIRRLRDASAGRVRRAGRRARLNPGSAVGPWAAVAGMRSTLLVLAALVLLWEVAVRTLDVPPILLPAPSRIAVELASAPMFYVRQSADTLMTTLAGFALAVVLGVGLAIGIVYSRLLERVVYTLLVALNSLPKVALAPLFVIWLGTGVEPKIAIAVMLAIFSIVVDMVLGLRSIDPDILAMAHVSRARPIAVLWKIRLPNALPTLFAGMKVGVSFALVGAIVE